MRKPPEFVITTHAEQRFKERVQVNPNKMLKMTMKAWESTQVVPRVNQMEYRARYTVNDIPPVFRFFMGYIFIFQIEEKKKGKYNQKILVTVINPKRPSWLE